MALLRWMRLDARVKRGCLRFAIYSVGRTGKLDPVAAASLPSVETLPRGEKVLAVEKKIVEQSRSACDAKIYGY